MKYALHTPLKVDQLTGVEENFAAHFAYLGRAPQTQLQIEPEVSLFTANIPYLNPHFNNVFLTRFTTSRRTHAGIECILAWAQDRGLPLFWTIGPSTKPANLGYFLELYGFSYVVRGLGMVADLDRLVNSNAAAAAPAGLMIERVRTNAQLQQYIHVLATNSNMPASAALAWLELEASMGFERSEQRYLATWRGEPVATASIFAAAGAAGLYHVATLPQARGQGIGTTICRAALQDAYRLGYSTAVLISTPMGEKVYRRLGFEATEEFHLYTWPGKNE